MLSTTLYAGAAVAVAAKLFGQEAVLFADSGSVKTIFQRRFFRPAQRPTAAQAFFLLAVVFSPNFFAQQQLLTLPGIAGTLWFWYGLAGVIITLFLLVPLVAAAYMRVAIRPSFGLDPAAPGGAGWRRCALGCPPGSWRRRGSHFSRPGCQCRRRWSKSSNRWRPCWGT